MLFCLLPPSTPCAAKTLVVVLLPGTGLADWQRADAPHLHQLLANSALAVMNTRTARRPDDRQRETPESAVLTLGAGARATGGTEADGFLRVDQRLPDLGVTAGQLYDRRTGTRPPAGSRVNVQWPRLQRENVGLGYDVRLGNLSDALRDAGVTVKALGGPLAWGLAADSRGVVTHPPPRPFADECLFWDAGSNLGMADAALGRFMRQKGVDRMVVLSPDPGDVAYRRGDRLCPVAFWGPGIRAGLLSSSSTRRAGLVTNTDFAASVAAYFGIPAKAFPILPFGVTSWNYRPLPKAADQVAALEQSAVLQRQGMQALPYIAVFLGIWMLGLTLLRASGRGASWGGIVPAGLILALILSVSLPTLALWLVLIAAAIAAGRRQGPERLTRGLAAATALALVGDLLLKDPLMRVGLLGYSAIEGARYYGIGNEAMGALVGACLVCADALSHRPSPPPRLVIGGLLLGVTMLIGAPGAGAKAGGLMVALAAFGGFLWLRSGHRLNWRITALAATGILIVLLTVAALDARLAAGQQSHYGRAVGRLMTGGVGEWGDIVGRKLAVEGRLLTRSAWAVPVWGGLVGLLWLARRPEEAQKPLLWAGMIAVAACLAVNDAGTVAGALCLSLIWGGLISQSPADSPPPDQQAAG